MIKVDENIINSLKGLASSNPGAYFNIIELLFNGNFKELNDQMIHLDPDPGDQNFSTRYHYRRGFVAALDTLRHLFADPDGSLPTQEMEEKLPENNEF